MSDIVIRVHRVTLEYSEEIDGYGVILGDVPPGAQVAVYDPTIIQDKEHAQATVVVMGHAAPDASADNDNG